MGPLVASWTLDDDDASTHRVLALLSVNVAVACSLLGCSHGSAPAEAPDATTDAPALVAPPPTSSSSAEPNAQDSRPEESRKEFHSVWCKNEIFHLLLFL